MLRSLECEPWTLPFPKGLSYTNEPLLGGWNAGFVSLSTHASQSSSAYPRSRTNGLLSLLNVSLYGLRLVLTQPTQR